MTEEIKVDEGAALPAPVPTIKFKGKRDVFRFKGDKSTAINLEHVTQIELADKRITFTFYTNAMFVDLDNPEVAQNLFEQILHIWAHDVVE